MWSNFAPEMVYFIEFSTYSKFKVTEHTNNPNKMINLVVYFIVQWKQNNDWDEIYHIPVYIDYFRLFIVATGCPYERRPQKTVSCYGG